MNWHVSVVNVRVFNCLCSFGHYNYGLVSITTRNTCIAEPREARKGGGAYNVRGGRGREYE